MKFIPRYKNKTLLDKIFHKYPKFLGYEIISEDDSYLEVIEPSHICTNMNSMYVGVQGLSNIKILEKKS